MTASALEHAYADSDSRRHSFRESTRHSLAKAYGGGGSSGVNPISMAVGSSGGAFDGSANLSQAAAQYRAAQRDYPYTAIRPIATKIAGQPIRVGTKKRATAGGNPKLRTKSFLSQESALSPFSQRLALKSAPEFIKAIAEGMEIQESHPLLEAIENPNPYTTKFALMFNTAFSIEATGMAFWWIDGGPKDDDADGTPERPMTIWYLPASWVESIHEKDRPFARWKVKPIGSTDSFTVEAANMLPFGFPDPSNPTQSRSPMQTQAKAINTDEMIQEAQHSSMKNSLNPGLVLTAGRLPAPPGQSGEGQRPVLTAEQRKQLITAIQLAYRGVQRSGDPIILDGLIESVTPYRANPTDLDFPAGSQLTKDRVMQGIGTSTFMTGQTEGANRATAYVVESVFCSYTVNPLITLMSETITKYLGSRGAPAGVKVYIWIEEAKPHDADLRLSEIEIMQAAGALTKNELREAFDMKPIDDASADELPQDAPQQPPPTVRPQRPGQAGQAPAAQGKPAANGQSANGRPVGRGKKYSNRL